MRETLPFRYSDRPDREFYCRVCHEKLLSGDPFILRPVIRKIVACEHFPACPRQPKPAESSNIATA